MAMKVRYGVGLLNVMPQEWFVASPEKERSSPDYMAAIPKKRDARSETKELRRSFLERVAALKMSPVFHELCEDEVLEVTNQGGKVTSRWLGPSEGNQIARTIQSTGGELLYDQLPSGFDADFYFPGYQGREGKTLTLPDHDVSCFGHGLLFAVNHLRQAIGTVDAMDREFVKDLLTAVEVANANRLIFWLWFG